jgi:hypothetical protein
MRKQTPILRGGGGGERAGGGVFLEINKNRSCSIWELPENPGINKC